MIEARDEKQLLRFQKRLASYKLLIIDEPGFVPLSKTGAELLFEVFSQRYERGAILVTSQPAVRRVDRGVRRRAPRRGAARPPHPPRPHPRDERRELPPQGGHLAPPHRRPRTRSSISFWASFANASSSSSDGRR